MKGAREKENETAKWIEKCVDKVLAIDIGMPSSYGYKLGELSVSLTRATFPFHRLTRDQITHSTHSSSIQTQRALQPAANLRAFNWMGNMRRREIKSECFDSKRLIISFNSCCFHINSFTNCKVISAVCEVFSQLRTPRRCLIVCFFSTFFFTHFNFNPVEILSHFQIFQIYFISPHPENRELHTQHT